MSGSEYPVAIGITIDQRAARFLVRKIASELRRMRYDGERLEPSDRDLVESLQRLASVTITTASEVEPESYSMDTKTAAALLSVGQRQVTNMVSNGTIRGRRVSGAWRLNASDVFAERAQRQ